MQGRLRNPRAQPRYVVAIRRVRTLAGVNLLAAIIALVTLTSPFGDAEASAIDLDEGLTVDVVVEVTGTFEAVLVRPFSSFEELPPTALADLGDGTWAGAVRLPTAWNWSVVFDALTRGGESSRSEGVSLLELGVDPVVVGVEPTGPAPSDPIPATTWWLVGGVVLALVALGLLGWWTFADQSPESGARNPESDAGEAATDVGSDRADSEIERGEASER